MSERIVIVRVILWNFMRIIFVEDLNPLAPLCMGQFDPFFEKITKSPFRKDI